MKLSLTRRVPLLATMLTAALIVVGWGVASAGPCIADGQTCRTDQSCCSGVCVKDTKKSFGTCTAIQCCVRSSPMGAFDTCTVETPAQCASRGGIAQESGTCSPNPCPPITTTTTTTTVTTTTTTPSCSGWGGGCDTGLPGGGTGTCCPGLACVRESPTSDFGLCAGATCTVPSDCPGGDCADGRCCSVFAGECALGCCPGLACGNPFAGRLEICLGAFGSPCTFDFQCSQGHCDPATMTCGG
jgi:hypothetical protein